MPAAMTKVAILVFMGDALILHPPLLAPCHAANVPEVIGLLRILSIRALPFPRRRGQSVAINGKNLIT
jgi:hypothetical protein